MKKITVLLLFVIVSLSVLAQKKDKVLVQFTGIVHNNDTAGSVVPYVNIVNISDNGVINQSNYKGYFSFVAHEQDTIFFSCVGYNTIQVIIPAHVPSQSYTVQVALKSQIANLPPFRVFPWATIEEFTKDFLSMRIADDDLSIARKNLNHNSIALMEQTLYRNGEETNTAANFHNTIARSHYYTNPLFNPFAWGNLINSISAGDKSRGVNTPSGSSTPAATTSN